MTIKELYDWAKSTGIEDFQIQILYRDHQGVCGGFYRGSEPLEIGLETEISTEGKKIYM